MDLRVCNLPKYNIIKRGFEGRDKYVGGTKGLKAAIGNRPKDMKATRGELLKEIEATGINIYKQVEMYKNYRPIVPPRYHNNEMYRKPSKEVFDMVKNEKSNQKEFHGALNAKKTVVQRKNKILAKVEDCAFG